MNSLKNLPFEADKENPKPKSEKKIWRTPLQDITNTFTNEKQISPTKNTLSPFQLSYDPYLLQSKPASKSAFKQIR